MVEALRKRKIDAVVRCMDSQFMLFTIIGGKEAKLKPRRLDDAYLVAGDCFIGTVFGDDATGQLERISRLITLSETKAHKDAAYLPHIVRSRHNDLTRFTIRGSLGPHWYWELHYIKKPDGRVSLQRVCEFDHAEKFVW